MPRSSRPPKTPKTSRGKQRRGDQDNFCGWCGCDPGHPRTRPAIGIFLNGTEPIEEAGLIIVIHLEDGRPVIGYRILPGMPFAERGIDVLFPVCSSACESQLSEALKHWRAYHHLH